MVRRIWKFVIWFAQNRRVRWFVTLAVMGVILVYGHHHHAQQRDRLAAEAPLTESESEAVRKHAEYDMLKELGKLPRDAQAPELPTGWQDGGSYRFEPVGRDGSGDANSCDSVH